MDCAVFASTNRRSNSRSSTTPHACARRRSRMCWARRASPSPAECIKLKLRVLDPGAGLQKRGAPRLGSGAPERAFLLLASFSHQRVGSSILASLSEAGGNDLQKVTSKPLPPRLSLLTFRLLKRAHTPLMHGFGQRDGQTTVT